MLHHRLLSKPACIINVERVSGDFLEIVIFILAWWCYGWSRDVWKNEIRFGFRFKN